MTAAAGCTRYFDFCEELSLLRHLTLTLTLLLKYTLQITLHTITLLRTATGRCCPLM
jgi:hypothetical protein